MVGPRVRDTTDAMERDGKPVRNLRARIGALQRLVDRATLPRIVLAAGPGATPNGRDCWIGVPRRPGLAPGAIVA